MTSLLPWILGAHTPGKTFVLGVNGPQGAGKTTLCQALCAELAAKGFKAITLSIDDFYLTRAQQVSLSARFPADPYLQQRGYPGTHDVDLGARILDALRANQGSVLVPRYDKSLCEGQGDREPESRWTRVGLPLDFVLFEGWMLGFVPVTEPPAALAQVNAMLAAYEAWNSRLDGFLQLEPLDYHFVLDWRVEAEARMKAQGKPGMSEAAIRAYIEKFLPAYETYQPALQTKTPGGKLVRRVKIGKDRAAI
ncbi:MAG: glycerate kinase [Bdellovibrionota bacterium]